MSESERELMLAIAQHLIEGWSGSPMADDLQWKLDIVKDEIKESANAQPS